jgi:lipoprotein NlpI
MMNLKWLWLTSLTIILVFAPGGAVQVPNWEENRKRCADGNPDLAIGGCTALIESGQETPIYQAIAFYNRGTAYGHKGEYDKAIADYDAALRLKPDDPAAFSNRGSAYRHKGEYDKAIADSDTVIRLNPNYPFAYLNRGVANFYLARFPAAASDFEKIPREIMRGDAYLPLWLHLARVRAGQEDATELKRLISVAAIGKGQRVRRCETRFFTAEQYLLEGKKDAAIKLLHEALELYEAAGVELKRIGK